MKRYLTLIALVASYLMNAQLKIVYSITPSTNIDCDNYVSLINTKFYFQGTNPSIASNGAELYTSDSTEIGTQLVKNINPNSFGSSNPGNFTALNASNVLFTANDGIAGRELWITDGTSGGTSLVKDIYPGSNNGPFEHFTKMGSNVFFMADDGTNGYELWKSNGTTTGTQLVKNINASGNGMQIPVLLYSKYTAVLGNTLFFVASDGTSGFELYKTDGTTIGTSLVKDIYTGATSSNPSNFTILNGWLYFTATSAAEGNELWKTDGTLAGTSIVKDLAPLVGASSNPNYLLTLNSKLYFAAIINSKATLCESDGSTVGTTTVFPSANFSTTFVRLTKVDSAIYFFDANNSTTPVYSLYKFNAVTNSTNLIKANLFGAVSGPAYQPTKEKSVGLNGMLYFTFDDVTSGDELWQSDGTTNGTKMITDIGIGALTSWIDHLIPVNMGVNSRLYFTSTQKAGLLYIKADAVATTINSILKNEIIFSVYPNPAKELLNIKLNRVNNESTYLKITNLIGEEVMQSTLIDAELPINIQHLKTGIYFVTITDKNTQSTQKIIIE
jgi:trimeric autotransporter adhesin